MGSRRVRLRALGVAAVLLLSLFLLDPLPVAGGDPVAKAAIPPMRATAPPTVPPRGVSAEAVRGPAAPEIRGASTSSFYWTRVPTPHAPGERFSAAMAFDPLGGSTILFGGDNATCPGRSGDPVIGYCNDTWSFSNGTWTNLNLSRSPSPREQATMAYDPAAGGLVLFGGWAPLTVYANGTGIPTSGFNYRNDTWLYRNGTWTNLTGGSAPPANESIGGGLAYDPNVGGLVFVGLRLLGSHEGYALDPWAFVDGAWSELAPPPIPALSGGPGAVVYDASLAGLVVGPLTPWSPVSSWGTETWYVDRPTGWEVLGLTGNFSPVRAPGVYVANASAIVGFGTVEQLGPNDQPIPNASYNATWMISAFHLRTVATPSAPSPREEFALTYDPTDDTILLFGGLSPSFTELDRNNETWELHDLAGAPAPQATIHVAATPGICGNVVWDRTTSVPNGSEVATSFGLHFLNGPNCSDWVFQGWNVSGSVSIVANGSALGAIIDVSGDGGIFGWYSPAFTLSVIVLPYLCGPDVRVNGAPTGYGGQVPIVRDAVFGTTAGPCSYNGFVFQGWTFGPGLVPIGNSTGPAVNVSITMNATLTAFYGPPPAVSPADTLGLIVLGVVIFLAAAATVAVLLIARRPRRRDPSPPSD